VQQGEQVRSVLCAALWRGSARNHSLPLSVSPSLLSVPLCVCASLSRWSASSCLIIITAAASNQLRLQRECLGRRDVWRDRRRAGGAAGGGGPVIIVTHGRIGTMWSSLCSAQCQVACTSMCSLLFVGGDTTQAAACSSEPCTSGAATTLRCAWMISTSPPVAEHAQSWYGGHWTPGTSHSGIEKGAQSRSFGHVGLPPSSCWPER
jgi:hypothetical protein